MYEESTKEISYIKIMFAVCGGVLLAGAIASVISLLLIGAAVDAEVESINRQVSQATQRMREIAAQSNSEAAQRRERQQTATEQQRVKSETGRKLSRECDEYSQFNRDNPSEYARQQRDKACGKYRTYVSTGKLSN